IQIHPLVELCHFPCATQVFWTREHTRGAIPACGGAFQRRACLSLFFRSHERRLPHFVDMWDSAMTSHTDGFAVRPPQYVTHGFGVLLRTCDVSWVAYSN